MTSRFSYFPFLFLTEISKRQQSLFDECHANRKSARLKKTYLYNNKTVASYITSRAQLERKVAVVIDASTSIGMELGYAN